MALPRPLRRAGEACYTGGVLWLAGFRDALCLHRCLIYFVHDPRILAKTANCFLLNGVIFGGSLLLLEYCLRPAVHLLLTAVAGPAAAAGLGGAMVGLYHVLWLLPAYVTSLLVNCIWYGEIAELVVAASQRRALQQRAQRQGVMLVAGEGPVVKVHRPDAVTFVSQEAYRAALFAICFLQVAAAGAVPRAGPALNFLLLSWLYALYCFDYKWALHGVQLQQRVAHFERHWAFFLGFGCATVLPLAATSYYTGAALVGMLFPLYLMAACDSSPRSVVGGRAELPPLPIFRSAAWLTNKLLQNASVVPRLVRLLRLERRRPAAAPTFSDTSSMRS